VLRKIRRHRVLQAQPFAQIEATPAPADNRPAKFCLYEGDRMEIADTKNIKFFFAEQGEVYAYTAEDVRYSVKQSLQEIEANLDKKQFFRCHRNYIVNIDFVKTVSPWFNRGLLLTLTGTRKFEIPVSRAQTKNLEQYIHF